MSTPPYGPADRPDLNKAPDSGQPDGPSPYGPGPGYGPPGQSSLPAGYGTSHGYSPDPGYANPGGYEQAGPGYVPGGYGTQPAHYQGYGTQPAPYQGYGGYPPQPPQGLAIASLVTGVLGIFVSCFGGLAGFGWLGLPLGIAGLVCGFVALNQIKAGTAGGRGMAIAGIVTSGITLALIVLSILAVFGLLAFIGFLGAASST